MHIFGFGRNDDFDDIYNAYVSIMYSCAYEILYDRQLAEDAVQEAFMRLMRHTDRLEDGVTDRNINFVYTITRRIAINIYNKRKHFPQPYGQTERFAAQPDSDNSELYEAMSALSDEERDLLLLKYVYGFSQREIAGLFAIKQSAAGQRIKRAKDKLAQILKEKGR